MKSTCLKKLRPLDDAGLYDLDELIEMRDALEYARIQCNGWDFCDDIKQYGEYVNEKVEELEEVQKAEWDSDQRGIYAEWAASR